MYLKRLLTYSILSLVALGGFLGSVHIEIEKSGTQIVLISYERNGAYATASDTVNGTVVGATTPTNSPPSTTSAVDKYNSMIDSINIALAVLSVLISPIILFVGWLMSPDWTSGDLFGLRAPMYSLWVTVSNIVYFVYAILLILIALGTMFGHDKFSYKVMLPKLALGILMVPFTWWFVQWTISIASVVTASVMTIPAETITDKSKSKWFTTPSIPTEIEISNAGIKKPAPINCSEAPEFCISPKDFLAKSGGMYGPLVVYGYSVFKFKEINRLSTTLDIASAALQIVHTSIVSTIMFAVFGLLVLALAAMLMMRAIKLWVYAIFSPLFTFQFVAGSAMMGGDKDTFTIKEFVGLCFVPAIVGLALSFGLIMINAVQGPDISQSGGGTIQTTCNLDGEGCTIANIMGSRTNKIVRKNITDPNPNGAGKYSETSFTYGDIKFKFLGKAINQSNESNNGIGALDAVGGMFGTLIIDIIALVFIWMAFMAAKNVSKAVAMAVEPFEKIGQQVGSLAKSIPKYTPIPGLGMSAASMGKTVELGTTKIDTMMKKKAEGDVGRLFPTLVEGIIDAEKEAKMKKSINEIGTHAGTDTKLKAAAEATSVAQSGSKYMDTNFEKLTTALKGTFGATDVKELNAYFLNHNIKDDKERAALIKMYKGEAMDATEKERAWNANTKLGTTNGASNPGTPGSNTISIVINGDNKYTFTGGGFNLEKLEKKDILATLNKSPEKLKGMTNEDIKKALTEMGANEQEINTLTDAVEKKRVK